MTVLNNMTATSTSTAKPRPPHKQPTAHKRPRPVVEVVTAASAFPISKKKKDERRIDASTLTRPVKEAKFLDWHETAKEVHKLGASAMVGQQKRDFEREQYKLLTGRDKKQQRVPLPIVRGIRKKAEQRLARQIEEAKEAGIVLPVGMTSNKKEQQRDKTYSQHGPAPSIGYVTKGVLKLRKKPV
jgi:hypothetical protein